MQVVVRPARRSCGCLSCQLWSALAGSFGIAGERRRGALPRHICLRDSGVTQETILAGRILYHVVALTCVVTSTAQPQVA